MFDVYKLMYSRMLAQERGLILNQNRPQTRFASSRPPLFERPNSDRFLKSITYQAPKLWAELPAWNKKNMNESSFFHREVRKLVKAEMQTIVTL